MQGQAAIGADPAAIRKKNQAFGVISDRLRRFYSELEALVDPNTEDFFQRVMRQMEREQPRHESGRADPTASRQS
jgi:hypothetical protein